MEKRVLIAVDESEGSLKALKFVAESLSKEHKITLFSVLPDTMIVCQMHDETLTPYFLAQRDAFCALEDKKKGLLSEALNRGREILLSSGFPRQNVEIKLEREKKGVAKDIIAEAEKGYDLVVLGRRGLSGLKEFFLGSVSQKVLQGTKDKTVLLVG
ncbi:MAG: universal stress protein [Desulfatiglandales bacterium]